MSLERNGLAGGAVSTASRRRLGMSIACIVGVVVTAVPSVGRTQTVGACRSAEVDRELDHILDVRSRNRELAALHARALFERCPTPRVRAQVGFDELEARHYRAAYPLLRGALENGSDPWVRAQRERLERAANEIETHLPRLSPQTNVPGAELRVDGTLVGRLPLRTPRVLITGSAVLELSAPGYRPLRRTVSLADGDVFREMLTLVRESQTPTESEGPRTAASPTVAQPSVSTPSVRTPARRGPGAGPWIVAGTGVALVIAGGVFWALRETAVGNCAIETDAIACPTDADAARAQGASTMGIAANVSFGLGIAAAVGGIAWLVFGRRSERTTHVAIAPSAGGASVTFGGAF